MGCRVSRSWKSPGFRKAKARSRQRLGTYWTAFTAIGSLRRSRKAATNPVLSMCRFPNCPRPNARKGWNVTTRKVRLEGGPRHNDVIEVGYYQRLVTLEWEDERLERSDEDGGCVLYITRVGLATYRHTDD